MSKSPSVPSLSGIMSRAQSFLVVFHYSQSSPGRLVIPVQQLLRAWAWSSRFCQACGSRPRVGQGCRLWPLASSARSSPRWGTWSDSGGPAMDVDPPCDVTASRMSSSQLWRLSAWPACGRGLSQRAPCGGSCGQPEPGSPHGTDSQPGTPDSTPPQLPPQGTEPHSFTQAEEPSIAGPAGVEGQPAY